MSTLSRRPPKAVLFDAYGTLFDVHSVVAAAEQLFPGQGDALSQLWRLKQIEYSQLRTLADPDGSHYKPFWNVTLDALRHAARRLRLELDPAGEKRLMDQYACLSAFPDAGPALQALRECSVAAQGRRLGLGILSNGNPDMLHVAIKSAGLGEMFDQVLSVDAVHAYKPAPAAYALGTRAFDASPRDIVFVSSNGWDVAGAGWFGYTTFWINRAGAPREELESIPRGVGNGMADLVEFVKTLMLPEKD
jgi:2-haloacid dehalogenase